MKKYFIILFLVLLVFVPSITFASWWNPVSWFVKPASVSSDDVVSTNSKIIKLIGKEKSLAVKLGDAFEVSGIKIIVAELIEDSRCPLNTKCIQTGTVRVKMDGKYGLVNKSITFSLNKPVTFMGYTGTLVSVAPEKTADKTIALSNYVFTFSISKIAKQ